MCLIVSYYYKKIEDEINCIMKIKRPFMKIVLLNEVIKHLLFKPKFLIIILFDSFQIFQYPYYSINTTFHDSHAIKVHHIDKCNKNCRKVDIFTSILACLSSSAPILLLEIKTNCKDWVWKEKSIEPLMFHNAEFINFEF